MGDFFIIYKEVIFNIIISVLICVGLYLVKRYSNRLINKFEMDVTLGYNKKKTVNVVLIFFLLLMLLTIWNDWADNIITFIGFFSAGLAIAMKDIILNLAGGLYVIWAKPFKIGERIEMLGCIGDVIDVGALEFTMLEVSKRTGGEQSTGRIVHIPNMQVFYVPLINYEKGFRYIWQELSVKLTLDSDWEKAKELLGEILEKETDELVEAARQQIEEAGKKYLIYYNNLTPIIYTEVVDGCIVLFARYLCEPRRVRTTEHSIWEKFLKKASLHKVITIK